MTMYCPECEAEMKPLLSSWYCPFEEYHGRLTFAWCPDPHYAYAMVSPAGTWGRLTRLGENRWMWEIGRARIMAVGEESTPEQAMRSAEQSIRFREAL